MLKRAIQREDNKLNSSFQIKLDTFKKQINQKMHLMIQPEENLRLEIDEI